MCSPLFSCVLQRFFSGFVLVFFLIIGTYDATAESTFPENEINKITSIDMDSEESGTVVHIRTLKPVGYRYTVYDSSDPVRVVIDFPGMDASDVSIQDEMDAPPVEEIRVSELDLTSGKLGRVELLLEKVEDYDISLSENDFKISFGPPQDSVSSDTLADVSTNILEDTSVVSNEPASALSTEMEPVATITKKPASMEVDGVTVTVHGNGVDLNIIGHLAKHQYFTLGTPPRLVVDLYGVKPAFQERVVGASGGFSQIRVGTYPDKTRFVFDAEQDFLPRYEVRNEGDLIRVVWGEEVVNTSVSPPEIKGIPVTVEGVDFQTKHGSSVLSVDLSGSTEVTDPSSEGELVRFRVKNALISRALRRTIDASAFPSAVRLVTPYTVQEEGSQDVIFAIELKGPVMYSLEKRGDVIEFTVEDGPFAEALPSPLEELKVPIPFATTPEQTSSQLPSTVSDELAAPDKHAPPSPREEAIKGKQPVYTGEKISLVFEDADIRRILQLIAEVSNLNIIAGDEIKGTITLRLIDVPWDQALDLIMEIKGLGMLRAGNVVRVLPQEKIREMRQAQLNAVKVERQLEPLLTETISVSYTDLKNVSGPSRDLLSDRGKLTEDPRNKQIIITDIQSVIAGVRRLIAILDTPERQVMIEARIVEADTSFSRDLGVNWGLSYSKTDTGLTNISQGDIGLGGAFVLPPGGVAAGTSAGFASALTFGELGIDSTVLDLQISALETAGRGKVISRPRVTTLNGEQAAIAQGTKIPYQSISDQGIKTEFIDAVLSLEVTPVINPDDSIILEITATNSSIGDTVNTGAGSAPAVDTKEAKTKLLLQDGQTTVLGGILVETDRDAESGVPFLGKIPLLKYLFTSRNTIKDRSELLIFITPRIVQ